MSSKKEMLEAKLVKLIKMINEFKALPSNCTQAERKKAARRLKAGRTFLDGLDLHVTKIAVRSRLQLLCCADLEESDLESH
jgi:hypothetical protein